MSIGAIAGGCVGGIPGLSLGYGPRPPPVTLLPGVGKSNRGGGGRSQVDPTGWIDGSDTVTVRNAQFADYLTTPIRRDTSESREPFHLDVVE